MAFTVLPAIDVAGGRLGVWTPHGPGSLDVYGGDPVRAADAAREAGATWVHLVDMDHALGGTPLRTDLIERFRASGLSVQASGGIADAATVARALDAGAGRVVLGSAALVDEALVASLLSSLPAAAVLVGLDCRDGTIVARGRADVELELVTTVGWLVAAGAPGFLVTSVTRVGGMAGPDVATIRRVLRAGRPVVGAGGIASIDDLRAVRDAGGAGAVVGRAALDGALDLRAALAWADGA